MRHIFLLVLSMTLTSIASSGTAHAGWTEFWRRFHLDTQRMNCWPSPFYCADQQSVRATFQLMTDNGWRSQNTLGDHFFDLESERLTRAGELKVHWIIMDAPLRRRTVFVLRGHSHEATSVRLDSVQQAVARMLPGGPLPPVLLTDVAPGGGSGEYFETVDRTYRSTIPEPRLPEMSGDDEN